MFATLRTGLAALTVAVGLTAAASAQQQLDRAVWGTTPFTSYGLYGSVNNTIVNWASGVSTTVVQFRFSGTVTSNYYATYGSEARIRITAPDGEIYDLQPFPESNSAYTTLTITDLTVAVTPKDADGIWVVRYFEGYQDNPTGPDATWTNVSLYLDGWPVLTNVITTPAIHTGAATTASTLVASKVAWFQVVIPKAAHPLWETWVDMDTIGSSLSATNDTVIALYDSRGTLITSNDDSGYSLLSALSYGATTPLRGYGGLVDNGDGRNGWLEPGLYFVAVTAYPTSFSGAGMWPFFVLNYSTYRGTVVLNVRSNIPGPCNLADITGVGGPPTPPDEILTGDDFVSFINAFAAGCP